MEYYAIDKNGNERLVTPELRDTLIASGKRKPEDFYTKDASGNAPQASEQGWQDQPVDIITGKPRTDGGEGLTTLEPISGDYWSQVNQTLYPNLAKAEDSGAGTGQEALGWARDVGSLPMRTVLGVGSGIGAALGGEGSLGDRASLGAQTMQGVMGTPMGTPIYRGNSLGDKVSNALAGIITDPSLPVAAMTAGVPAMAGKAFASPLVSSAVRAGAQAALGAGEGALSSPGHEALGASMGGIVGGGSAAIPDALNGIGGALAGRATPLFEHAVKAPTPIQEAVTARTPEMLEKGVIRPTFGGTIDAIRAYKSELGNKYAQEIAANKDAQINIYDAALDAAQKVKDMEGADRLLLGASDEPIDALFAQVSQNGGATGKVPLQNALNLRNTIGNAFGDFKKPNAKYGPGTGAAAANIEGVFRDNINKQLDQIAPGIRSLDDQMSGAHTFEDLIPSLLARKRQFPIGLRELMAAGGAGAAGSRFGIPGALVGGGLGIGTMIASKTPAAAYAAQRASEMMPTLSERIGALSPYASSLSSGLLRSAQPSPDQ